MNEQASSSFKITLSDIESNNKNNLREESFYCELTPKELWYHFPVTVVAYLAKTASPIRVTGIP